MLFGGVNISGEKLDLPQAFTFHGSYYAWVPDFSKGITIIAVGNSSQKEDYLYQMNYFKPGFDSIEVKESVFCPYARDNFNAYFQIFLCKGLKYDSDSLKYILKNRIFE